MSGRKACHLTETDALTSWQWWKQVSGTRHTPRDKHTPSHIQDPCKFYKHIKPWKLKHRLILTICEPSVANTVHHIYRLPDFMSHYHDISDYFCSCTTTMLHTFIIHLAWPHFKSAPTEDDFKYESLREYLFVWNQFSIKKNIKKS